MCLPQVLFWLKTVPPYSDVFEDLVESLVGRADLLSGEITRPGCDPGTSSFTGLRSFTLSRTWSSEGSWAKYPGRHVSRYFTSSVKIKTAKARSLIPGSFTPTYFWASFS